MFFICCQNTRKSYGSDQIRSTHIYCIGDAPGLCRGPRKCSPGLSRGSRRCSPMLSCSWLRWCRSHDLINYLWLKDRSSAQLTKEWSLKIINWPLWTVVRAVLFHIPIITINLIRFFTRGNGCCIIPEIENQWSEKQTKYPGLYNAYCLNQMGFSAFLSFDKNQIKP